MSQNANIKDSLDSSRPPHRPPLRPGICQRGMLQPGSPPSRDGAAPSPGPHCSGANTQTIWCESGLMKVQHGAKWVSTTAGRGANDETAPRARCCRGDLCRAYGSWRSALLVRFSVGCILRTRDAVLLSRFHPACLLACSFLLLLRSYGLLAWLLDHKDCLLEVCCDTVIIIIFLMWV